MSRVTSILDRVRLIVSDKASTRWSDPDLLSLFNEGLNHFVLHTQTLRSRKYILIEDNIGIYDISPYSSSVTRVQYLSKVLPAKTMIEMDKRDSTWEDTTGTEPKYVIFDEYESNKFRLYPKVASGSANIITQNSFFGGLIDITVTDDLLLIPEVELITQDLSKYVVVYHISLPRTIAIDSLDTDIDLHSTYDHAMIAYISGQCLVFDQDSISKELGASQLGTYESYIVKAIGKEGRSNNTATDYETEYRSF